MVIFLNFLDLGQRKMPRLSKDPKRKTWPAGGGSRPAAGGSGALDLDQLAADLGSGTVNRAPAGGGSWIWKRSSSRTGQRLAAGGWRILTSWRRLADLAGDTIDQLGGTLAAA